MIRIRDHLNLGSLLVGPSGNIFRVRKLGIDSDDGPYVTLVCESSGNRKEIGAEVTHAQKTMPNGLSVLHWNTTAYRAITTLLRNRDADRIITITDPAVVKGDPTAEDAFASSARASHPQRADKPREEPQHESIFALIDHAAAVTHDEYVLTDESWLKIFAGIPRSAIMDICRHACRLAVRTTNQLLGTTQAQLDKERDRANRMEAEVEMDRGHFNDIRDTLGLDRSECHSGDPNHA